MSVNEENTPAPPASGDATIPGAAKQSPETLTKTGRLLCSTLKLLEAGADAEYWLTQTVETIGSDGACSVQIRSSEISPLHARMTVTGNRWTIQPGVDGHGVTVNGTKIEEATQLTGGDEVRFGPVVFSFSVLDVAPTDFAVMPAVADEPETPAFRLGQTLQLELSPDGELIDVSKGAAVKPRTPDAAKQGQQPSTARARTSTTGQANTQRGSAASESKPTMEASMTALQEALPSIIQRLVLEAKSGNVDAACACLNYAARFAGRK